MRARILSAVGGLLITAAILLGMALLASSCATLTRWDAELAAKRDCRRRLCHEAGGVIRSQAIGATGHYVHWCCPDTDSRDCVVAREDCEVTL